MKLDNVNDFPTIIDDFAPISKKQRIRGQLEDHDPNRIVTICVFLRTSLELLGSTNVDPQGFWEVDVLECPLATLLVIAKDESGVYNCDVYDRCSQSTDIILCENTQDIIYKGVLGEKFQCTSFDSIVKFPHAIDYGTVYGIESIRVQNGCDVTFFDGENNVVMPPLGSYLVGNTIFSNTKTTAEQVYPNWVKGVTDILGDGSCTSLFEFKNSFMSEDGKRELFWKYGHSLAASASYLGPYPMFGLINGKYIGTIGSTENYGSAFFIEDRIQIPFALSFIFIPHVRGASVATIYKIVFIRIKDIKSGTVVWDFEFGPNASNAKFAFGGTGITSKELNYAITLGQMYHVVFNVGATTVSLQINGVTVASTTYTPAVTQPTNLDLPKSLTIGIEGVPNTYFDFNFHIAKLRIFNKILNDTEASIVYNADFVNYVDTDFTIDSPVRQLTHDYKKLGPVGFLRDASICTINFAKDDFYFNNAYANSSLFIGSNALSFNGLLLNGSSILHKVKPSTGLNTNSSLPDHSDVSIIGKINTVGTLFTGNQCIYKSGDSTNGIAVFIDGAYLTICGRVGGAYSELQLSNHKLANSDYIFVYDSTRFSLYDINYTLLDYIEGQVLCGISSTDQESIGNSAGNSPISAITNNPEYYKGIVRELIVVSKGAIVFSTKYAKKLFVEDRLTKQLLDTTVVNVDPVNNDATLVVKVPSISSVQDIGLRLYSDIDAGDNDKITEGPLNIPTGISADWDTLVSLAENDNCASHDVLRLDTSSRASDTNRNRLSFSFPFGMYKLEGDNFNKLVRVSSSGFGVVKSNIPVVDAIEDFRDKLYIEFVLETDTSEVIFGLTRRTDGFSDYPIGLRQYNSTSIYLMGTGNVVTGVLPLTAGTVYKLALDISNRRVYIGYNEYWIKTGGGALSTSFLFCGVNLSYTLLGYFPAIHLGSAGSSATVRMTHDEFVYPAPAGFSDFSRGLSCKEFSKGQTSLLLIPNEDEEGTANRNYRSHDPLTVKAEVSSVKSRVIPNTIASRYFILNKINGFVIQYLSNDIFTPGFYDYSIDFYIIRNTNNINEYVMGSMDSNYDGFYIHLSDNAFCVTYMADTVAGSARKIVRGNKRIYDFSEHHVAVSIKEGKMCIFIDGVLDIISPLDTGVHSIDAPFIIGNAGSSDFQFDGYISNVRIYKGFCRWTANFDRPLLKDYYKDSMFGLYNVAAPHTFLNIGKDRDCVQIQDPGAVNGRTAVSSFSRDSGKVYIEFDVPSGGQYYVGVCPADTKRTVDFNTYPTYAVVSNGIRVWCGSPEVLVGAMPDYSVLGVRITVGIAIDFASKKVYVSRNGIWVLGMSPDGGQSLIANTDALFAEALVPFIGWAASQAEEYHAICNSKYSEFLFPVPEGYTSWEDENLEYINYNNCNIKGTVDDYTLANSTSFYNDSNRPFHLMQGNFLHNSLKYESAFFGWSSITGQITNQKLSFDLGRSVVATKFSVVNGHFVVSATFVITEIDTGIRDFQVYGTNSITAFQNTAYSNVDDLTLLGSFSAFPYSLGNHVQEFTLNNTSSFRYYVLRVANNHGHASLMRLKHVRFYSIFSGVSSKRGVVAFIDNNNIERDLNDFPLQLKLNSSSGISSTDLSTIFDILGSSYEKLYVSDSTGTNLNVEVVEWDHVAKEAVLWVKVPVVKGYNSRIYNLMAACVLPQENGQIILHGEYSHKITITSAFDVSPLTSIPVDTSKTFNGYYGIPVSLYTRYALRDRQSALFVLGTKDFCVHAYVHMPLFNLGNSSYAIVFQIVSPYAVEVCIDRDTREIYIHYVYGTHVYGYSGVIVPIGATPHISLSRRKRELQLHYNGELIAGLIIPVEDYSFGTSSGVLYIGCNNSAGYYLDGATFFLLSLHVGDALWNTNKFVPPVEPMSLNNKQSHININFSEYNDINPLIGLVGSQVAKDVWSNGFEVVSHLHKVVGGQVPVSKGSITLAATGPVVEQEVGGIKGLYLTDNAFLSYDLPFTVSKYSTELYTKYDLSDFTAPNPAGDWVRILDHTGNYAPDIFHYANTYYFHIYNPEGYSYFYPSAGSNFRSFFINQDGYQQESYAYEWFTLLRPDSELAYFQERGNSIDAGPILIGSPVNAVNSFGGFVYEYRLSSIARTMDWNYATLKSIHDRLCLFQFSEESKFVLNPRSGLQNASISDIDINTSWMTEELTDFPLQLKFSKDCGLNNYSYDGFFNSLRNDADVLGPFIRNYKFYLDSNPFDSMILNNMPFSTNPNIGESGLLFPSGKYATDSGSEIIIKDAPRLQRDLTVACRFNMQPALGDSSYTHYMIGKVGASLVGEFCITVQASAGDFYALTFFHNKVYYRVVGITITDADIPIYPGTWYSLVAIRRIDPSEKYVTLELWINGALIRTGTFDYCPPDKGYPDFVPNERIVTGSDNITIGVHPWTSVYSFNGSIENVIVAQYQFSDLEINEYCSHHQVDTSGVLSTVILKQDYTNPVLKDTALTSIKVETTSFAGKYYCAVSFDKDTYFIFKNSWIPVSSCDSVVTGGTDNIWYYLNSSGVFIESEFNTAHSAITQSLNSPNNQVEVTTLDTWDFTTSGFNPLTGICEVSLTFINGPSERKSVASYVTNVLFNNKYYHVTEPLPLDDYNEKITDTKMVVSTKLGDSIVSLSDKIKIYCRLNTQPSWTPCVLNEAIPVLTEGMVTTGKSLIYKIEFNADSGIESNGVNIITQIF